MPAEDGSAKEVGCCLNNRRDGGGELDATSPGVTDNWIFYEMLIDGASLPLILVSSFRRLDETAGKTILQSLHL